MWYISSKDNLKSIKQIKLIKGFPDIDEGTKVSIALYNDKISINDKVVIPLNSIKRATTFTVRGITNKGKRNISKISFYGFMFGPFRIITVILNELFGKIISRKTNFLSIEYINKQGQQCNGLFITGDKSSKFFADAINKQLNTS